MHFVQRLIAVLLIVTLPIYGWAALGLPGTCPMQGTSAAQTSAAGHGCCKNDKMAPGDDGSTQPADGSPCQAGQQCQTGSLHHPQANACRAGTVPVVPVVAAAPAIVSPDPAGIWHPPRPF